ncbi:hypothetical protein SDC9_174847 [bioreactor metagenome]|uniref:Uncharacterized protein n=1 Tax=bioreactor metagenome TaxID=1076179 RepID=A0A645GTP2_9ZZZZ
MELGAPKVGKTLLAFFGRSCSGTTPKSKGSEPIKEGVIKAQLFAPKYFDNARLNAAVPLPAEIKRVSQGFTLY